MFKSLLLIGAVMTMAGPALAETACGTAPIPPAIATGAEIAGKTTDEAHTIALTALKGVKAYQVTLSSFRECLGTQTTAQKAALANAKDDKAKKVATDLIAEIQAAYDKTVDTETAVVTDYSNLHNAYCKMGDGLTGCAKPKS